MKTVLLIIGVTILVYGGVFARGLFLLYARLRKRPVHWRRADTVAFTVAIGGLLVMAYGKWIEPNRVDVQTVRIAAPIDGIRIVQISDLHSPSNRRLQRRLPELIAALRPDAIVFTGDAINTQAGLELARQTFRELASIAPMYGVRGNRDDILGDADLFATTGVMELRGDAQRLVIRADSLVFTGASRNRDWLRVRAALRQHAGAPFVVHLSHSPDAVEDVSRWGADLVLAGHTHGGQIALPGYGALWTGSRFGKRFEAGLYEVGATRMYINRGIGTEAVLPKLRINARPEVTLLLLGG